MEFRVLGTVEVSSGGRNIALGPRQQRLLLAILALNVNRAVPVARLVDITWPGTPPPTAQHAIHVRICGLRAALLAAGPDGPAEAEIVTRGEAYLLRADPMSVDAHRFRAVVRRAVAEADDEVKVRLLKDAAALWRGPPLTGAAPLAVAERLFRGLEETRLMALEDRLDAELRLGRHRAVLDELTDLVAEQPYRQRLVGQLMLGLYRDGRGPDAVTAYLAARSRLADGLGLDPPAPLQALYLGILRGDPALGPPTGSPAGVPGEVRDAAAVVARPASPAGAAGREGSSVVVPVGRRLRPRHGRRRPAALARLADGLQRGAGPALAALRLTKRYGDRTAVDQLSFTAERGEVLGLLGANGAGKTTTIRLLTTMLAPTRGEFSVAGVPHTSETEIRHRVGVLPEGAGYPGRQTGLEYLAYHARLFGMTRAEAAAAGTRLLAAVGLADRGGSRISTYSRGMRQRLGVARALLNDPSVVLLDEPTLGLDATGRRQVLELVRGICADSGATVVLSTHSPADVEEVRGRALVLEAGRAAAGGPVAEVARGATGPGAVAQVPPELADRAAPPVRADRGPGPAGAPRPRASWRVVAGRESRDLWVGGRGLVLLFGFSVLMSVLTFLAATSQALDFLDQRDAVGLATEIAVTVGVLVTLVVSADALSGERERGTLEGLLLTPVPRRAIAVGKLVAALSVWVGTFLVSVPYIWVLGRGISLWADALLVGLLVGTVLAVGLAALGLLISSVSSSNRVSLSVSLLTLIALFVPSRLPPRPQGSFGHLLGHVNPVAAGIRYLDAVLTAEQAWSERLALLVSPVVLALLAGGTLLAAAPRVIRLRAGVRRA